MVMPQVKEDLRPRCECGELLQLIEETLSEKDYSIKLDGTRSQKPFKTKTVGTYGRRLYCKSCKAQYKASGYPNRINRGQFLRYENREKSL